MLKYALRNALHYRSKYGIAQLWWRPAAAMLRLRWSLWRHSPP